MTIASMREPVPIGKINRTALIMREVAKGPMTAWEMALITGMDRRKTHGLMRFLLRQGFLKAIGCGPYDPDVKRGARPNLYDTTLRGRRLAKWHARNR